MKRQRNPGKPQYRCSLSEMRKGGFKSPLLRFSDDKHIDFIVWDMGENIGEIPSWMMKFDSIRFDKCKHWSEDIVMFREDHRWVHRDCRERECEMGDMKAEPIDEPRPFSWVLRSIDSSSLTRRTRGSVTSLWEKRGAGTTTPHADQSWALQAHGSVSEHVRGLRVCEGDRRDGRTARVCISMIGKVLLFL